MNLAPVRVEHVRVTSSRLEPIEDMLSERFA
jgi:hypothetical protein